MQARREWRIMEGLRLRWWSERWAVRRTIRKEKRYGGAERAWDVRAELPILWGWAEGLVYVKCRVRKGKGGRGCFILFYYCG